jgi:hypothetical protein
MIDPNRNSQQSEPATGFGELRAEARRIETIIRVALEGHAKSASLEAGLSETAVSRFKTGSGGLSLSDVSVLLAALKPHGLHVVEATGGACVVPGEELRALAYLAGERLKGMRHG